MIDDPLNRLKVKRGEALPQSKLSEDDVRRIRKAVERRELLRKEASALTNKRLAEQLGVHQRTVEKVIQGYSWCHV